MNDAKLSQEEKFRSSLEDVAVIIKKLSAVCLTPEEMVQMVELAQTNDGQLRTLMLIVNTQTKR